MGLLNSNSLNEWLTGIPERAREAYRGLLNTPSEVKQLFDPQFQQGLLKNATPVSREDIINQGLNISGMAPYGMAGHIVYHGSPHKFNKFDMSKIGTGEGAQAYGHGLYMAETEDVAKRYRDTLTNFRPDHIEASLIKRGISPEMANTYAQFAAQKQGGPRAFDDFASVLNEKSPSPYIEQFRARMRQEMPKLKDELGAINGQLYKVDIPDESIPRMLDWDRGLDQQSQEVRDVFMQMVPKPGTSMYYDDLLMAAPSKQGGYEYKAPLSRFYQGLGSGSHADLSQKLKQQGIPGIKYLDGMSRSDGTGTYNYVLFDDQLPRILEVNGQPTGLLSWADEAKKVKKKK